MPLAAAPVRRLSRWLVTVISTVGLLLGVTAPMALAQEQTSVDWDGQGSEHAMVECPDGQSQWHFVLTPGGDATITDASLSVELEDDTTTNVDGSPSGEQEDGAWHFWVTKDGSGTVVDASATLTFEGDAESEFLLTISDSECLAPESPTVSLIVTKIEQGDSDITLEGASFDLYLDDGDDAFDAGSDTFVADGATGEGGTLTFTELDPNETYLLHETAAPEGYEVVDDGVTLVEIGESDVSVTVENAPEAEVAPTVSLTVTKVEQGDEETTLEGASFELFADDGDTPGDLDGEDSSVATGTTGADGTLTFTELDPNATYFLDETAAPEGYEIVDDGIEMIEVVESDVSVTVENAPVTEVSPTVALTITKVEQGEPDTTLAGATFELYLDDGDEAFDDGSDTFVADGTTGEDGTLTFTGLSPDATYFLVETDAPDDYEILGDGVRTIAVGDEDVAETVPNAPDTDVLGDSEERDEQPAAGDDTDEQAADDEEAEVLAAAEELPATGTDAELALYAAALVLGGSLLLLLSRSRLAPVIASRRSRRHQG